MHNLAPLGLSDLFHRIASYIPQPARQPPRSGVVWCDICASLGPLHLPLRRKVQLSVESAISPQA